MSTSVRLAEIDFSVQPLNERSLLLRPKQPPDTDLTLPLLGQQVQERTVPGLAEVIATTTELCLVAREEPTDVLRRLASTILTGHEERARRITLPACFEAVDPDDWDEVTRQTGLEREHYLERLCKIDLEVAMLGFLPGFVYLAGLPAELRCPRKADPTARVAAGSVAVGGPYAGVYGLPSPAGWQVIGNIPVQLVDPAGMPPLRLRIGDRLRLRRVSLPQFEHLCAQQPDLETWLADSTDD